MRKEKSRAKAAGEMAADKRLEVVALHHMVLAITEFAGLLGCAREVCFLSKKAAKRY
jgi:hypothetical protein